MKKSFLIIGMFLISISCFSQVNFSGEIVNAPDTGEISITYFNNMLEWEQLYLAKTQLAGQRNFSFSFNLNKPTEAKLNIGDQYTNLFIQPNDSINVTIDYNQFDQTIKYTGRGAAENNYLAAEMLEEFETKANKYSWFSDADKYKRYEDSIEYLNQEFLKTHSSDEFSAAFKNHIRATTQCRFINSRYMFTFMYDEATSKFSIRDLPATYFDFLKTINLNDQNASDNGDYHSALGRYLSEFNDDKTYKNTPDSLSEKQKAAYRYSTNYNFRKNLFKEKILDYQLSEYLMSIIEYNEADKNFMDELMKDYRATCKNEEYISIVEKFYFQSNKLAVGSPVSDFTLPDVNGNQVSLSSLKGKVVYIDFWATWCVPCISLMPSSEILMKKFKNRKDVVFLFVNVRDNMERWKKFLQEEKPNGTQLYADQEKYYELSDLYNLNAIPRYVLIDKKGNFIDSNAPTPEMIESELLKALNN